MACLHASTEAVAEASPMAWEEVAAEECLAALEVEQTRHQEVVVAVAGVQEAEAAEVANPWVSAKQSTGR